MFILTRGAITVAVLSLIAVVAYSLRKVLDFPMTPEQKDDIEACRLACEAICALDTESARVRAEERLGDIERFVVEAAVSAPSAATLALPALARDLFTRFASISTACGSASIGPAFFDRPRDSVLTVIGGGEDEGVLVMAPPAEEIFLLLTGWQAGSGSLWQEILATASLAPDRRRKIESYAPTVYHALLLLDQQYNG